MNTYELQRQLERDKPECPVCHKPCDPAKASIEIIMVPIPDRNFDTMGLLPVHVDRCKPEAIERMQRAQAAVGN